MENPKKFDSKSTTAFNQWWESVTMYLGFYPETVDSQKIPWVGTLLTDMALVWHLHRYREQRDNNTWVNYSAAIRMEYCNKREVANAQLKLGELRYQGSIRAYLMEFRALNIFAQATGEAFREKIDLTMTSEILRMRFAHYLGEFIDDEEFLQATYQSGLQVERMKALEKVREGARPPKMEDKKRDEKRRENRASEKTADRSDNTGPKPPPERSNEYGGPGQWPSEAEAFSGVPPSEKREHLST